MQVYQGNSQVRRPNNAGYVLFTQAWSVLNKKIKDQQNSLAKNIFIDVDSFIHETHKQWLSMEFEESQNCRSKLQYRQVPTAVVVAGVNTPDHRLIYDQLRLSVLKNRGRVAIIHSGSIISSARALVSEAVSQLVYRDCMSDSLIPSRDKSSQIDIQKMLTPSVASTYLGLYHWYYSKFKSECSSISHERNNVEIAESSSLSQPVSMHTSSVRSSSVPRSTTSKRSCVRRLTEHRDSRVSRTPIDSRLHARDDSVAGAAHFEAESKVGLSLEKLGPLVIVLSQTESIPSIILQEFIELTSVYVSEKNKLRPHTLPVVLVFGLCTSPEVSFEARLSASVLARLSIKVFTVPPPTSFLGAVLNELIDFPGFRLVYGLLSFLIDSVFLCLDFSVQNFVRRFKFCMLDHYLRCPHPQLMLPPDQAREYLGSLSLREIAQCVSVLYPSLSSSVIDVPIPAASVLSSPREPVSMIDHLVHRLEAHWRLAYVAPRLLRWLLTLIQPIPSNPLGHSIIDLYRQWLKDGLVDTQAFTTTMNLLHGLSKTAYMNALDEAVRVLRGCTVCHNSRLSPWPENVVREATASLKEFAKSVDQWCKELRAANEEPSVRVTASSSRPVSPSPLANSIQSAVFGGQRKMSLRCLKQHLQEMANSPASTVSSPRVALQTEWDQKCHSFVSWIRAEFTKLAPMPTSLPLHEVFYGPAILPQTRSQGVSSLRRRLNPPVHRVLHQTLIDPGKILQIPEFKLASSESLSPRLPDLCILYKLHLESLKMINMYDWLMAFATVLGESVDSTKPPSKSVQSRFFYGVAQLHHLGYIKSTRRKVDHVQRLTWGITI